MVEFSINRDALKDEQQGSSTDGSGILHQIVLCLALGQTYAQQVSHEVAVVEGQYLLCCLVRLWAVVQA